MFESAPEIKVRPQHSSYIKMKERIADLQEEHETNPDSQREYKTVVRKKKRKRVNYLMMNVDKCQSFRKEVAHKRKMNLSASLDRGSRAIKRARLEL